MYKLSIELFKVHKSFKVKFCLVYNDEQNIVNKFNKTINKFNFSGNDYLKITPYPYVSVDITSFMDKNEEWSTNRGFNMNRRELFTFISKLNRLYKQFVIEKELFYYDEKNTLKVNNMIAQKIKEYVVCGNKTILLQPCVVEDLDNNNVYEGIFLSINSIDYFTYLTYGDIEYLLYELKRIDMSSLCMQLLNTFLSLENNNCKDKTVKSIKIPPTVEQKEIEIVDIKTRIEIPKPDTIPDI